jgi:hypothetical protein
VIDRELGFIHIRLQTWFPFQVQVYLNGHEWLARQLAWISTDGSSPNIVSLKGAQAVKRSVRPFHQGTVTV